MEFSLRLRQQLFETFNSKILVTNLKHLAKFLYNSLNKKSERNDIDVGYVTYALSLGK